MASLATFAAGAQAAPLVMDAQYFTVVASGDPDFGTTPCCGAVDVDEVMAGLGPDGLPVANPASAGPRLHDVDAHGQLTWWTPSATVSARGGGTVTLPDANGAMLPPDGGDGFLTAIFRATLVVPIDQFVTFELAAADDAFLALDGTIFAQVGGVHDVAAAPATSVLLAPGSYALALFYAERHAAGAGLFLDVTTTDIWVDPPYQPPVPEPASLALVLAGLGLAGGLARRRPR